MNRFSVSDRDKSVTDTVSFHNVPMPRGLASAIRHIENNGAKVQIFSADRRDNVIAEHNIDFGTKLHGQKWLIQAHARDPKHYSAANPVATSSHTYHSDGNPAYVDSYGYRIPAGGKLPWYELGIDLADHGKTEDVSNFLKVAHKLGYRFVQPYKTGSERHHVVLTQSPVGVLERANQISKKRK